MDFKKFLNESPEKTAAFAFGRFNPPTVGHEKLIHKVKSVADEHGADTHIVASHSEGTAKDPIPQKAKLGYLKKVAPKGVSVSGASKESPSFLHTASKLHNQGYKHLVMVAGSDRTDEYHKLLHKYNNVPGKHGHYNFKSIKVVSAGQRDPDAEGVEGMSGTKMRAHARAGEMDHFKSGLPKALHPHAEEIANHIRSVKEEVDPQRESYISGAIFKLGDIVESTNGTVGEIVYRGSSYVTIQAESGNTSKHWLKDIKESSAKYARPAIRETKTTFKKLPALLMSKEQFNEMHNQNVEVTYNGYTTKNLDQCPKAAAQLKDLVDNSKAHPKYIMQAVTATDNYLGVEKAAIKNKFADQKMVHDFGMYLAIAHDTLNMLGYSDDTLEYTKEHEKTMLELAIHKDDTFANEVVSTIPTWGSGDVAEDVATADYRIATDKNGRKYKVRTGIIRLDKRMQDKDQNNIPDGYEVKESKKSLSSFRKSISESYPADPPTAHRDINLTPDKEVFHGLDKTIEKQGWEDKPLGMVSFKSFLSSPEAQKIEQDKGEEMQAVHREKAQLATHSQSYKQMVKHHAQQE